MKKIFLSCSMILIGLTFVVSNAFAYGGGGGFPPGYFDNPHARPGLQCEFITLKITKKHSVIVPRCKVVRAEVHTEVKNKSFWQRIIDFSDRVKKGGY